mmetsp:Transcript_4761/g.13228  ORF Transcript_4761/g.13228 Transcript_4761/m.13228 type:complete len:142 (+) Transcript_4761:525-950(+)
MRSPSSTMSATSEAASTPPPMAMPTSARARAAVSFTPSPTIATRRPCSWNDIRPANNKPPHTTAGLARSASQQGDRDTEPTSNKSAGSSRGMDSTQATVQHTYLELRHNGVLARGLHSPENCVLAEAKGGAHGPGSLLCVA